jgi:hypothetical protein
MWCVFHNAQRYWSDNLCKLVTDQWRASLGVHDSESCWFTEEIGTYMRCWESPGDLPLVIEIFVSVRSFRCTPFAKRHKISITRWKMLQVCGTLAFSVSFDKQAFSTKTSLLRQLLTSHCIFPGLSFTSTCSLYTAFTC